MPRSDQLFTFEDPRQERIYRRLLLVGPGPAGFYRDACRLMAGETELEATSHMVAHLVREIESAIQDVLEPLAGRTEEESGPVASQGDKHGVKIRMILDMLGTEESEPVRQTWLDLSGRMHKLAHRDRLVEPRIVDDEFRQFWTDTEFVLDSVLERFETRYLGVFSTLDELLALEHPTTGDAKFLASKLPNNQVSLGYFFEKLSNLAWLQPLDTAGFFDHPADPVRNEEEGTIAFPPWPASRYLARVARNSPEKVIGIALRIESENVQVQQDLIDAAISMPPEFGVKLAARAEKWVERPYLLLPSKIGAFISYLAEARHVDAAIRLARELLRVERGRHRKGWHGEDETPPWPPAPSTRVDTWEYEQFLQHNIPDLIKVGPSETLTMLCDVLEQSLEASMYEQSLEFEDLSQVWRPAIESHEKNAHYGGRVRDLLIDAVRDTATDILEAHLDSLRQVVRELETRRWVAFRRISLYLVHRFGETDVELVAEMLTGKGNFDDTSLYHEYWQLATSYFGRVGEDHQSVILEWIGEGPDLTRYVERVRQETGNEPSQEQLLTDKEYWQFRRLSILKDYLLSPWQQTYEALAKKYTEPEHPEFLAWSSGVLFGPTAPKTA